MEGAITQFVSEDGVHKPSLLAEVGCGKQAVSVLITKKRLADCVQAGWDRVTLENEVSEALATWHSYKDLSDKLKLLPSSPLVDSDLTFACVKCLDPTELFQTWKDLASATKDELGQACQSLTNSMEIAAGWKASLMEGCSMDDVMEKGESTLMQVKGKKVAMNKDALEKAQV